MISPAACETYLVPEPTAAVLAKVVAASEAYQKAAAAADAALSRLQAAVVVAYRAGITQTRLATLIGVSQATISRWIRDASATPSVTMRPGDAVRAVTRATHRHAETETALNRARSRRTVAVHHAIRAGIGADSAELAKAVGEAASRLIEMRDIHGPADLVVTAPVGHPVIERLAELLGGQHSVWVEHRGDSVNVVVRIDHTAEIPAEALHLLGELGDDPDVAVQVASWSVLGRRIDDLDG